MKRIVVAAVLAACISIAQAGHSYGDTARPCLQDGDRVVLLGDTFFEREGDLGFIETALVASHPDASLTFRNLGWSGDTVWAESRGVFDPPAKGYARMLDLVKEVAPTVIFVAYGRNESFRGPAGLRAFREQLSTLCDDLRRAAGGAEASAAVRLVLVTPHPVEGSDAEHRNATLAEYSAAIRETAAAKQAALVDLFANLSAELPAETLATENGVHLSAAGYAAAARVFAAACGKQLPADFVTRSAPVRQIIVEKNRLFFHRWRPANETYIFLFRKHEQGNNAVEIPQFDPLVDAAEARVRAAVQQLR